MTAAAVALIVYRTRAERAMLAAWQAPEGGHPMTAATAAMTKTGALAIARQARRYGHWADAGPDDPRAVSVDCPRCRQRVHAVREPRRASRGPLYESPGRALDRAMLAHLTGGWCAP